MGLALRNSVGLALIVAVFGVLASIPAEQANAILSALWGR